MSSIDRHCASVNFLYACGDAKQFCDSVLSPHVANQTTMYIGRFATRVLSLAPAICIGNFNCIGRSFAHADAIGQGAVSIPSPCAGSNTLTHARTHACVKKHVRAGNCEILTRGSVASFARSVFLVFFHFVVAAANASRWPK